TPPSGTLDLGDRRVTLGASLGRGSGGTGYRGILDSPFGVRRPGAAQIFGIIARQDHQTGVLALGGVLARAACLRHRDVVGSFEMGVTRSQRQPFILNELVEGTTLRRLIERLSARGRRLPLDIALFIGTEMAEGLAGARAAKGPEGGKLGIL